MKRWEKALLVAGVVVAAMLAILPWIDRLFPTEIRMAPVVESSTVESEQPEPPPEEPAMFPPEPDEVDRAEAPVEPVEPDEPLYPDVPDAIVPEELPPPSPPPPPIES